MNELTNHGVSRAFQLLWRRRPRVAAASWCKRRYGREREWRSRVGLTECGKCGSGTSVDNILSSRGRFDDIRTSTIWEDTLARIIVGFSQLPLTPGTGAAWGEIARLMINHGAAVDRKVIESALKQLRLIFNHHTLNIEKD